MPKLIALKDFQLTKNNPISLKGTLVRAGINRLKTKGLVNYENNERVIEIEDLILEMYEIARLSDARCGSNNNPKGL
jgi:hypothetical protein